MTEASVAEGKRSQGILMVVFGALIEVAAIVLMVSRTFSQMIAIALVVVGIALVAAGLGMLRRDRDANALKRPHHPL
jgi:uncharacterized membrane protein HdeD (DUF308 family)